MGKKLYVTYHWRELHGNRSETKAIECNNLEEARECACDIISLCGIRNVRLNRCGKLPKKCLVIPHEDYKSYKFIDM